MLFRGPAGPVSVFSSYFNLLSFSSYIIPWLVSNVKGLLIFFLPSKKVSRVEVFWLTPWAFRKYSFGTSRKHLITFLTFKFHFHNQSLVWVYTIFLSVIGKGIEPHPTDEFHGSISDQNSFLPAGDLIEKISHPLPRRQGRLQKVSHFLISSYIYYYTVNPTKSQGFINLFLIIILLILLSCSSHGLTEVFNSRPCCFFTLESLLQRRLSIKASPLQLRKQPFLYQLIL